MHEGDDEGDIEGNSNEACQCDIKTLRFYALSLMLLRRKSGDQVSRITGWICSAISIPETSRQLSGRTQQELYICVPAHNTLPPH